MITDKDIFNSYLLIFNLPGAGNKELIGVLKGSHSLANWALPRFSNEKGEMSV
jgi:hypothetical protein